MRVLVTGATGFIGRHICARLLASGHEVVAAVRDPASAWRRFPGVAAFKADLNSMTSPAHWTPLLEGVDAVVNAAGILQSGRGQSARAVHIEAPVALFEACLAVGVRRVVQISAVSADEAAGTEYALTKKAADDRLRAMDLDWIVIRPSLVYAQGSYGGTSVLRGLAGLPWFTPLIGNGEQVFMPIHADDLAEAVIRCLEGPALARRTLDAIGPEILTTREILARTRAWLDLKPARALPMPEPAVRLLARLGDALGAGPMRTTALDQMAYGNVSDPAPFEAAIGFRPRAMGQALIEAPSHVQDRWHARLYFLRPALTATLALLWVGSGLAGLLNPPADADAIARAMGAPEALSHAVGPAFSLADIAIGTALATGHGGVRLGLLQIALVGAYTLGIGVVAPALWADPFGSLVTTPRPEGRGFRSRDLRFLFRRHAQRRGLRRLTPDKCPPGLVCAARSRAAG